MYPLKFKSIYKPRIWGGQRLREFFNKDIPPFEKIGESWELTDLPDDKSVIVNGRFAGLTLGSVFQKFNREITGFEIAAPLKQFPLMIKFLDANDILSVQVHPDDHACRRMGKGQPKIECWYIIDAKPDAFIYKGLKKGVTKTQFAEAIKKGSVEQLLSKIPVRPGQCHFLPAGTVHSTGDGILIAEVETPSDTTYRVFDWNRLDDNGKQRQLHIDEALETINFNEVVYDFQPTTIGRLVESRHFNLEKACHEKNCKLVLSQGAMQIFIFLKGNGTILNNNKETIDFVAGDTLLIPANCQATMNFNTDTQFLKVSL